MNSINFKSDSDRDQIKKDFELVIGESLKEGGADSLLYFADCGVGSATNENWRPQWPCQELFARVTREHIIEL